MFHANVMHALVILWVALIACCAVATGDKDTKVEMQTPSFPCNDMDTCLQVHLENTVLTEMLAGRCNLGEAAVKKGPKQRITFSHLPKTGGSSVRDFLKANAASRARSLGHEHFVLAALDEPDNLFATMMREPVSRALSFYAYARSCPALSKDQLLNKLWATTYTTEPVPWSADPFMQRTLYQDPLGFFLRDIVNISDSITRFNYTKIQELPVVPLKDIVPGTLEVFLSYTSALPEEFQCRQHLEVGFIFLKHYEVVGTLEKLEAFYKIFLRRAHVRDHKGSIPHSNKSKFVIPKEDRAVMERNLKRPLFCATVLWRIAGLISDQDMACPN